MYNRRRRLGFTLIELLVVVAIIALLMAIIMPALAGARENAKKVKCLANVRAIGSAMYAYSTEWNGAFPSPRDQNWNPWDYALSSYMHTDYANMDAARNPALLCPFDVGYGYTSEWWGVRQRRSYRMVAPNGWGRFDGSGQPIGGTFMPYKLSAIGKDGGRGSLSDLAVLADWYFRRPSVWNILGVSDGSSGVWWNFGVEAEWASDPTTWNWHPVRNEGASFGELCKNAERSVLFFDGHAETLRNLSSPGTGDDQQLTFKLMNWTINSMDMYSITN